MNPSTYSSVHTETNLQSYASIGDYYDAIQLHHPCTDYTSSLYEDTLSSTGGWSGESLALGAWSYADQALFEAFLTTDVASISPSGPCTVVPMQSSPSYDDPQPASLHDPTEAGQLHALNDSQLYPFMTAPPQPVVFLPFEQSTTACASEDLSQNLMHPEGGCLTATVSQSSRANRRTQSYCPYPSPSPEASPEIPSAVLAWQRRNVPATTSHPLHSEAFEQPISWTAMSCIAPDLVYLPTHCEHDLRDHHLTDASAPSPRASHRATHRSSSSSPYPSPPPELAPRTSSMVIASQRRNAPARTAAPVSAQTWQCPHCPYIQRSRRSPDLKRHIKTHMRGADVADWVCCGVPVLNAIELGVPAATVREAEVFEFDGMLMIGGCRKAFSRRDALSRHLQREKGRCFGDAQSLHQRGNRQNC